MQITGTKTTRKTTITTKITTVAAAATTTTTTTTIKKNLSGLFNQANLISHHFVEER